MRIQTIRHKRQGQRGIALLLVIFALILVSAIGLGMMSQTDTETAINSNFRDQQVGYYAAAAGLEEARDRIRASSPLPPSAITLPAAVPGTANSVVYITNDALPWDVNNAYYDDEICKEVDCSGSSLPPTSGWYKYPAYTPESSYGASDYALQYKWARITLKMNRSASKSGLVDNMYVNGNLAATSGYYVCWNGTNEVASSAVCGTATNPNPPVYTLTSLAVTSSGSRRMLQYELTRDALDLSFPGALTLVGPSVSVGNLPNSSGFQLLGTDSAGCNVTATGSPVPAVAVSTQSADDTFTAEIPAGRTDHYQGSGGSISDVESLSMPADYQSVSSLEALLSKIKAKANQTYLPVSPAVKVSKTDSDISNLGTVDSPQTIFVDGDLTFSGNVTGYGTLVVTGVFSAQGSVGWHGPVLVIGEGTLSGGGGGSSEYDGAIIAARTRDNSHNLLSSLGTPSFDFNGGGGNGIHYSSGCLKKESQLSDYRILSSRELMY